MNLEILGTVLGSFGGAAVIVAALARFLGKVWSDRLAKQATSKMKHDLALMKGKLQQDLQLIKTASEKELEHFKYINSRSIEEVKNELEIIKSKNEQFGGISLEFYQDFFNKRVNVYLKLLSIKNKYITEMEEEFITEIHQGWGHVYHSTYVSLRELMIKDQLYISNELESALSLLRKEASRFIKEADFEEAHIYAFENDNDEREYRIQKMEEIYNNFATETDPLMRKVMSQIESDVHKLRARIELDGA
jgi:hypothetical protein